MPSATPTQQSPGAHQPPGRTGPPPDVAEYLSALPPDRRTVFRDLYTAISAGIGRSCEAVVRYGMISWVLPPSLFSPGYQGDPDTPLPFLSLASHKGCITIYHLGLYHDEQVGEWFRERYARIRPGRAVEIGTTCLRFADARQIPVALIGELAARVNPRDLIGGARPDS